MIRYSKGPEPVCLVSLRTTPGANWGSVSVAQRQELRDALTRDQGYLCAYCQERVDSDDVDCRIDHWQARSRGGAHFGWTNLVLACSGMGPGSTETCDRHRRDAELYLCPVDGLGGDPVTLCAYLGNGTVVSDDARALADLEALNLNAPHLARSRRAALDGFLETLQRKKWPSVAKLARIRDQYRELKGRRAPVHGFAIAHQLDRWIRRRGGE